MNHYLNFLFQQHILKSSSHQFNTLIKQQLLDLKPIQLTKLYKPLTTSHPLFNQLGLLLAKGVLKYSPANCTIQLSLPNLVIHQRMFKCVKFAEKQLNGNIAELVGEWVEQGLENGVGFPVMFEKRKVQKVFAQNLAQQQQQQETKKKSKSKPKHAQTTTQSQNINTSSLQQYNYHKLVYQYKSQQKPQLPTLTQSTPKQPTKKSKQQNKTKQKQQLPQPTQGFDQYMINVQQLTKLLQASKFVQILNSRMTPKEKHLTLFEFLSLKQRQSIMQQIRYQKLEQFLSQTLGQDCLLVFNLVKKYPYITQKQLIKLTLLQVLQTRASINKLVQKGLLYFYNETSRTIVYKVADLNILETKFVDLVATTIVRLTLAAERVNQTLGVTVSVEKIKDKLIELECEVQRLDDLLLMFGW